MVITEIHAENSIPDVRADAVPWLSVDEMRKVDRLMMDELEITLVRMMENAGRNVALLARQLLGGDVEGRRIVVLCGTGGNGAAGWLPLGISQTRAPSCRCG